MPDQLAQVAAIAEQARRAVAQDMANVRAKIRALPAEGDAQLFYDILDRLRDALADISKGEIAKLNDGVDAALIDALAAQAKEAEREAEKLKKIADKIEAYAKAAERAAKLAKTILKVAAFV
jgi:hypothetical protein